MVLALTQYDDSEYVVPVIEAGARGFVTKMAAFSELASAIQAVYRGDSFLSPSAAAAVVEECQQRTSIEGEKDPPGLMTWRVFFRNRLKTLNVSFSCLFQVG